MPSKRPANKNKTRCKNGHEFTPENTACGPYGQRRCRTCNRNAQQAYRAANPDAAKKANARSRARKKFKKEVE